MYYFSKLGFVNAGVVQEGIWPVKHHEKHHIHENIV